MKTFKYVLIGVILCSVQAFSQSQILSPFSVNQQKTASISADIKSAVDDAKIINVDLNIVNQVLNQKADKISLRIPFQNRNLDVDLKKFDILTPDAKIVAGTEHGDKRLNLNNSFVVYTSELHDKNFPLVVLTFFQNEVSALIISSEDVFVLSRFDKENVNADYILFQGSKVKQNKDFVCGTESFEIPERIKQMQKGLSENVKDYATTDLLRANVAIECDYEAFSTWGGTTGATNYILRLIGPVSAVYVRDINVQLRITYLRVWDTPNDPYPDATSSNTLLNAFRAYWNANMQSVPRTIAHMITPRPGGLGGIAWVGVLCANLSNGFGYAFSDVDGTFNPLPAYSWDVMVVSHETGHNFGSPHTHNCTWPGGPIDTCYVPVEGGCYNGPAIPRIGTVMSYCHLNGQISLTQGFGPLPSQLIRNAAESASCLNVINGMLVAIPNGGEIYRFNGNAVIVWGTNLTSNVNIEYTTNNGGSWSTIQNNVSATQRTITWSVPSLTGTTTQAKIRVSESGNPGNSDQSDSTFQIRPNLLPFNMISPPLFSRYYTSPNDTTKIHFIWSKAGTLAEIRYRWNLNNNNNTINYNQFSNNNGTDSVASISLGKIDSIIAAWGINVGDSLRGRWFVKAYTQLDSLPSTTSSFLITFIRGLIGIQPISTVIPKEFFVNPNYPNPFNPTTKIKFGLPKAAFVKLTVYDILGREVAILANEQLKAGEFEADWDASSFPSGVYFYKMEAGEFVKTSRMVLVK